MAGQNNSIPKKIWIYWHQGFDSAPFVVKQCVKSWQIKNPNWNIYILDKNNIDSYVSLKLDFDKKSTLPLALRSDFIRLALLEKFGGVWCDSTIFCNRPLDEWITERASDGFFAFSNPGKDRIIASWFLASSKNNELVKKCYENLCLYWNKNNFQKSGKFKTKVRTLVDELLRHSPRTARLWFHPLFTKVIKIYPYFALHYMFEKTVASDNNSSEVWKKTKRYSAEPPHFIQRKGFTTKVDSSLVEALTSIDTPVFKLNWRCDEAALKPGSLLLYIFEKVE